MSKNRESPPGEALQNGMRNWVRSLAQPPFYGCAALLVLIFLVTRLPFFLYYPLVTIGRDTLSYMVPIQQAQSGTWPSFAIRSPGYPLFVWALTVVWDRWLPVILIQNLLSLASSLYLVYGVYRTRAALAIPAALAMLGFLGSSQALASDVSALSESLYTSCVIVSFAFLLLAFQKVSPIYFVLASLGMAVTILVKPAGMYLAVIYVLVIAFMVWNRYAAGATLAFLAPFPIVLLMLCLYNYFTIHVFGLSAFGEVNLAGATIAFWGPDPSFPPAVNTALANELPDSLEKAGLSADDRQVLDTSWDTAQLYPIFRKIYNPLIDAGWGYGQKLSGHTSPAQDRLTIYLNNRSLIRQVELAAIQKQPVLYAKFVLTNLVYYFNWSSVHFSFYRSLSQSAQQHLKQLKNGGARAQWLAKEYATAPLPSAIQVVGKGLNGRIVFAETRLTSLHRLWQSFYWFVFQRGFWVWVYFAVFAASALRLLLSRGRHLGAFILFLLTASVLGASLIVCLVELALSRYAYPTQFVYYLSPALLPLLWLRPAGTTQTTV